MSESRAGGEDVVQAEGAADAATADSTNVPESPQQPAAEVATAESEKSEPSGEKADDSNSASADSGAQPDGEQRAGEDGEAGQDDSGETPAEGDGEPKKKPRRRKLPEELPQGAKPLFLSGPSQEVFHCTPDADVIDFEPYKLIAKEDIVQDFRNRASVCDFHPVKSEMMNYPGDQILIILDKEFKFGENYIVCCTEEAKEFFLNLPYDEEKKTGEGGDDSDDDDDDEVIVIPKTPIPQPWVNLGSDVEVIESQYTNTRPLITVKYRRKRRFFGAPTNFEDAELGEKALVEFPSVENETLTIPIREQDKCIQAIPETSHAIVQTDRSKTRNVALQYEPRTVKEEEERRRAEELAAQARAEAEAAEESNGSGESAEEDKSSGEAAVGKPQKHEKVDDETEINNNISALMPMMESALQQNEIMDIFADDYRLLPQEEGDLGTKANTSMKEFQSFTDLKQSKDKTASCVRWHPTIKGLVAMSFCHIVGFDERVNFSSNIRLSRFLILIWSFSDPIHPLLYLDAPEDVTIFDFCPTHPNLLIAGCTNGQLVVWDLSEQDEKLRNHMQLNMGRDGKDAKDKKKEEEKDKEKEKGGQKDPDKERRAGREREGIKKKDTGREREKNFFDGPTKGGRRIEAVRYHVATTVEEGHQSAITDLKWLPSSIEFNKMAHPVESKSSMSIQLITASADGSVNIWDIRPPAKKQNEIHRKEVPHPAQAVLRSGNRGVRVPKPIKHLTANWKPFVHLVYMRADQATVFSPYKLATKITQRKHTNAVTHDSALPLENMVVSGTKDDLPKLDEDEIKFFMGTEDGEVMYLSWPFVKDPDSSKWVAPQPYHVHSVQSGPVVSLERSPFFPDIMLGVCQWTFAIYKEGVHSGALLHSATADYFITDGKWSPTRPSVFFVCKGNGSVDVWDLLDKSHAPTLSQNVSALPLTSLVPRVVQRGRKRQVLLALGDRSGTLHIVELPWSLSHCSSSERTQTQAWFDREVEHLDYMKTLISKNLANAKAKTEAEERAQEAQQVVQETAEEIDAAMDKEYQEYLEYEHKLLVKLGIRQEAKSDDD